MKEGSLDCVDAKSLRADNGCYFNKRNCKIHFCTRRAEKHSLSTSEKSSLSSATGLRDDCCEYFISLTVHVLLCLDPFDFNRRLPFGDKHFLSHGHNIKHCKLSFHHPNECAGNSGGKDQATTANKL